MVGLFYSPRVPEIYSAKLQALSYCFWTGERSITNAVYGVYCNKDGIFKFFTFLSGGNEE